MEGSGRRPSLPSTRLFFTLQMQGSAPFRNGIANQACVPSLFLRSPPPESPNPNLLPSPARPSVPTAAPTLSALSCALLACSAAPPPPPPPFPSRLRLADVEDSVIEIDATCSASAFRSSPWLSLLLLLMLSLFLLFCCLDFRVAVHGVVSERRAQSKSRLASPRTSPHLTSPAPPGDVVPFPARRLCP